MNFPDEIKMISFEYQGQTHEIPLDAFAAAMDKICYLAFKAKQTKLPGVFNWLGGEMWVQVTDFEFPYTNDPEAVCAHLLSFGILDGFKFGFSAKKCQTVRMTNLQIGLYSDFAKQDGKTLFEWVFENAESEPEK